MDKLFNRFQKLNDKPLEETVFSKIWLVYDTKAKTQSFSNQIILKEFKKKATESHREHEIFILEKLNEFGSDHHPKYIAHDKNKKEWLAIEYLSNDTWSTLENQWGNICKLRYIQKVRVFKKILEAYKSIQKVAIHNDVTPKNIFLSNDYEKVKIIDFGASKVTLTNGPSNFEAYGIFSSGYEAPENLDNQLKMTNSLDVYKLGIIFHQLFIGKEPENMNNKLAFKGIPRKSIEFKDVEIKSIKMLYEDTPFIKEKFFWCIAHFRGFINYPYITLNIL